MNALIYEQRPPTPVRAFHVGDEEYVEYASNLVLICELTDVSTSGAWAHGKRLTRHPVIEFKE